VLEGKTHGLQVGEEADKAFLLGDAVPMIWSQTKKVCTLGFTTSDMLPLYGSPAPCQKDVFFNKEAGWSLVVSL
jgi:hypothetical protein